VKQTPEAWRLVFYISASVYIFGSLLCSLRFRSTPVVGNSVQFSGVPRHWR